MASILTKVRVLIENRKLRYLEITLPIWYLVYHFENIIASYIVASSMDNVYNTIKIILSFL